MKKFLASSLKKQTGDESHYVSDLHPVNDSNGIQIGRAGIFARVVTPEGTRAELIREFFDNENQSAEEQADLMLKNFLKSKKEKKGEELPPSE